MTQNINNYTIFRFIKIGNLMHKISKFNGYVEKVKCLWKFTSTALRCLKQFNDSNHNEMNHNFNILMMHMKIMIFPLFETFTIHCSQITTGQ